MTGVRRFRRSKLAVVAGALQTNTAFAFEEMSVRPIEARLPRPFSARRGARRTLATVGASGPRRPAGPQDLSLSALGAALVFRLGLRLEALYLRAGLRPVAVV